MRCPGCQNELPDGSKFCKECGRKLEFVCPRCGREVPPASKFCLECGRDLRTAKTAPRLDYDRPHSYTPKYLADKILTTRASIEGERKIVTVMFADVAGSTAMFENLDPEVVHEIMDGCFRLLMNEVHRYEGTINQFRGDGVMALFGAPIAHEDHALRACHAAVGIQKCLASYNENLKEQHGFDFKMRIGLNSGPVVVGAIGDDLRMDYTAQGDTSNLAARMENAAEPGTTYVTEETYRLTKGFFRFEPLGKRPIKGKEKPLNVYRIIGPSTRTSKFDATVECGLSRLIGRDKEIELLLDAFGRARTGSGQAVSITGEAGVGKSRLLYEFRKVVTKEDISFWEGRCLSYGRGVAYHAIIDLLKSIFEIEDDDTRATVTEKVGSGLKAIGIDEASDLPYYLELLSVRDSMADSILMSPAAKKDRILSSLQRLVAKVSEKKPLILAFEDLHFMDRSSEEAAKYLLDRVPGSRVLMILTYRPDFVATWRGKSFHSQLTLKPLSNRESLALAEQMLGGEVASDLHELILEKTEGVPFFIEEFIRTLDELAIIEKPNRAFHLGKHIDRVAIPSSIQDVIMARVDPLGSAPKEILQAGSVIEREFSYTLIKAITDFTEQELLCHLAALKEAELIYERGSFPQTTYVFRHAITRDVVYDSILTNRRKLIHQNVGKAIEEVYKDSIGAYHGILAHHFMAGEAFQKCADYSKLAHEKAWRQAALSSANLYAQKRISALEQLPPTPEVQLQRIDARTNHGMTLCIPGNFTEAREAIAPIVEMTVKNSDKRPQAQVYFIMGSYQYTVKEEFTIAFELLQKAIQSAEEAGDLFTATQAHVFYGLALCWHCQFESGAEHIQKALQINEAAQMLWGVSFLKSNLSYYVYNYQGKVTDGFAHSLRALEIAEQSGDIFPQAVASVCHGISYFYMGHFKDAEEHLRKGLDLCEKISLHAFSAAAHQSLGYTLFEMGDYDKSQDHHRQAILERQQIGLLPSCINLNKMALARTALAAGKADWDIASLKQLISTNRLKLYHGSMARHLADILSRLGNAHFAEAESWLRIAMDDHEHLGMKWELASDYTLLAKLRKSEGCAEEEKDHVNKALSLFKECGAEGWCRQIETGCAEA
jgi:class 3 adenylate cyclase/tetratricopeptide (TPR) repeat protein